MINKLENLPNEIFLMIYSHMTLFEIIESFCLLNKRLNNIIYFKFLMNKNGIVINKRCLSFNKCHSIITSKINDLSFILNCIQSIYIDGIYVNCSDIISEWIFHSKILRFINLKKVILRKCYLTENLIENLSLLIEYQLNELVLTFDNDVFKSYQCQRLLRIIRHKQRSNLMLMFEEFIRKLFSNKCHLTSLELDISNDDTCVNIHKFLSLSSNINSDVIHNEIVTHCKSLRYLKIDLIDGSFLENLIEHVPNLEILSVQFKYTLMEKLSDEPQMERFTSGIISWYTKMPKLKCFTLKSVILNDSQLNYLKWIINKVNYIEKLKVRLHIKDSMNKNSVIDVNFFRKYLMPDILIHLIDFDFYIVSSCKLLFENDIQRVIDSFKTDQFFIYRYWINIQCYFDPIMSYQHISSTKLIKPIFVHGIVDYPIFFDWKCVKYMMVNLCPSIIGCLKQFDILYPHIKSIQFNIDLQDRKGLGQRRRRAFDKLRKNTLSIIRHVEFCLPSCHYGSNESIHMGKNLVSVLSCYMPHIQTLRLWRDDDFPWTSIRPDYGTERMCQIYSGRWIESLRTFQSIVDHVVVFEQNLCELVQNLKELVFIDIYGRIHSEKIEPFRSMVKRRFPNSRLHIEISKFRLWI
ncbi:unnamed protein product [Rotaria sordida]|uniref:F-box domain-containing protein n=1 Tax=Rotaria sordida TaxID=392033 RepID=A0A815B879_9BILA|nr:unnamed protein product [Rotaria sordida]